MSIPNLRKQPTTNKKRSNRKKGKDPEQFGADKRPGFIESNSPDV